MRHRTQGGVASIIRHCLIKTRIIKGFMETHGDYGDSNYSPPGDKPPEHVSSVRKNTGTKQKWQCSTQ